MPAVPAVYSTNGAAWGKAAVGFRGRYRRLRHPAFMLPVGFAPSQIHQHASRARRNDAPSFDDRRVSDAREDAFGR